MQLPPNQSVAKKGHTYSVLSPRSESCTGQLLTCHIVARSGLGTCDYVYVLCEILQSTLRSSVPRWYFRVSSVQCLYLCPHANLFTRSGFYPGIHYMLGSWYSPQEIGKRAMIFWLAGSIGSLFSGFLQAAAYTNLSAVGGFAGWRWLFIIE